MDGILSENQVRLVVGLGNPGGDYVGTRHNIGFEVLDTMVARVGSRFERKHGHQGIYWFGRLAGRTVFFLKPMTYMNSSGESISAICRSENIAVGELLVVCDDLDIELGRLRLRRNGSSAGHNGTQSIIESLASSEFARLRIGIGKTSENRSTIDHVLSRFKDDEREIVDKVVALAVEAVRLAIFRGINAAMNAYNAKDVRGGEADGEKAAGRLSSGNKSIKTGGTGIEELRDSGHP